MIRHIPNFLSCLRLFCAIMLVVLINILDNFQEPIFIIFTVGAITDWLDGQIAKKYDIKTRFGEIIDPIADKALVVCSLLILMHLDNSISMLNASTIIIVRELVVSMIRQISDISRNNSLKVNLISRVKTMLQMLGIGTCLYSFAYNAKFLIYGKNLIFISVVMTVISFVIYISKSKSVLFSDKPC